MRTPSRVLLSLMLASAIAEPVAALTITIDSFEVGNFNVTDDATTVNATFGEQSGLPTTDVIGGVRLVRVLATASAFGVATGAAELNTLPLVDDGAVISVVAVPDGLTEVEFIYDGIADGLPNSTAGNLNLDLSAFTSLDVALTAVNVTGFVKVTISSTGPNQVDDQQLPLVNGVVSFPLGGFTLNLADIQEIKVLLSGIAPGEAPVVTSITAFVVPEPAAGLLVAMGLVGLGLRRRRANSELRSSTSA